MAGAPWFYDIACRFHVYLQSRATPEVLALWNFVTGKLHGVTHSMACQLTFHFLYHHWATFCSGEAPETVWAGATKNYLMAKYMSLPNFYRNYDRHFAHHNRQAVNNLPSLLLKTAKRVKDTLEV